MLVGCPDQLIDSVSIYACRQNVYASMPHLKYIAALLIDLLDPLYDPCARRS